MDRRSFLRRIGVFTLGAVGGRISPTPVQAADQSSVLPGRPSVTEFLFGAEAPPARRESDPTQLAMWEASILIRSGELGPCELLAAYLERIDRWEDIYSAYNVVLREHAVERARQLGASEVGGLLHGIPIGVKDNFFTRGVRTTGNSHIYANFIPESDATTVARIRAAGGIVLGKTQMGPLATTRALTPDGEITTVNAWAPLDPAVSPGGSSSGSATAVAARLAAAAIGTQTGGSITAPALAQGLTGLKPTMGRASLNGVIPLTYTRDHPGPLARDARDAAMLLQIMAGPDPEDVRTLGLPPVPDFLESVGVVEERGRPVVRWPTRMGVPTGWVDGEVEVVARARRRFLTEMERLGVELVEVDPPDPWEDLTSGAFNAVRLAERSELFLATLKADVRLFGVALSSWINGLLISGDEYLKGQRARVALLRLVLEEVFRECDVMIQTAPVPFDMIGLPLIAFPIGLSESSGSSFPEGVVLGGLPFGEERLLSLCAAWQAVSGWHLARPEDPVHRQAASNLEPPPERGRLGVEAVASDSQ